MLPAGNGSFQLLNANKPSDAALATAVAYRYSGYTDFPTGKYRLAVAKAGSTAAIKAFEVDLKPDTYFTVLVSPRHVDLLDDTADPKTELGTLTLRNFFPGVAVTALAGQKPLVSSISYGESFVASGLPLQSTLITLRATLLDGKPAEAGAEVDLRTTKRWTALVVPDSYGRFRVRVTPDGKNP